MKTTLILLTLISFQSHAWAKNSVQSNSSMNAIHALKADPRDLALVMDDLSVQFKIIKAQIADPSLNASSIQASQALSPLLTEALSITPEKILALPVAQQRAQVIVYQKLLLQLMVANLDLEAALSAPDQTAAQAAFTQIGQLIGAGHQLFK